MRDAYFWQGDALRGVPSTYNDSRQQNFEY